MKQPSLASHMSDIQSRYAKPAKLNLVSLMDIFTILVFFLLVNSGDNQLVKNNKHVELPASVSKERPGESLIVTVSKNDIVVGGRPVATMEEVLGSNGLIAGLAKELNYQAARKTDLTELEKQNGLKVTIMGDHEISYEVLKRVMATCADSNYRDLSLAVSKVANAAGSGA
ncbi:MAG: biopolymer transporter ExbD [Ketobacteraceae bacterium]|nr:biopolymer transporter ExbD [Ketobacteraceae bacterium]